MKDIKKRYSAIFAKIAYQGKSSNIKEGAIRALMASYCYYRKLLEAANA